jgi:hypothetical protein
MPKLRYQPPERLKGATDYSKHDDLRGSLNTVMLAKDEAAWVSDALGVACNLEVNHGRKREPGRWELAAIAFVASRHVDLQPWWDESTDQLWQECGFSGRPPYNRVWERLRELGEERSEAFLDAAALVIRRCRDHDPRVMAHVHVDSTEDESHAALVHDCQPGESCAREEHGDDKGSPGESARGPALRPERAPTARARRQREEWNEEDPDVSEESAREAEPEKVAEVARGGRIVKRVRVGGCWFLTRDTEAGTRAYTSNGKVTRFWHGYYSGKAVCALTSGVIPSVDPANKQEYDLFPALMDRVCAMSGATPETVIGDRGYSVKKCCEYATRRGIAPVFPPRKHKDRQERPDTLTHDRHGVMRCKHCGGETKQKRFAVEKGTGTPWLWFKCVAPATPDCAGEQRIRCETDWRSLIPLSRLEPLYHELQASHRQYEGVHDYWRDRYRVAADTLAMRPKIVSLNWHRLRANVACLIDWLRIAKLNDWLDPVSPPEQDGINPTEQDGKHKGGAMTKKLKRGVRTKMDAGVKAAKKLLDRRSEDGLDLPYGPRAAALGLGEETPPSERSGAPPGP